MGFWDALLGRTRPVRPNLDVLFAIPAAGLTLQAALGLHPSGVGAVCFKSAEGPAAQRARLEALALLDDQRQGNAGPPRGTGRTAVTRDEYGYTWITSRQPEPDLSTLVTELHAVNLTLSDAGFGPLLLCTVIGFAGPGDHPARRLALVYLFKRGTIYPFAPAGDQSRDTALELQVRAQLQGELPIEADLSRWFPIWSAPGL